MAYLDRIGLISKFQEVFGKRSDGIIGHIKTKPVHDIPHRHVIKMEEQGTEERPGYKCSLKTNKELPSFNVATYFGIDLMGSVLKLLY